MLFLILPVSKILTFIIVYNRYAVYDFKVLLLFFLPHFRVPLERDNSEEFLKREARANQLAEEIESSAQYKARMALENDERSEEEKYTAVQRNPAEREGHSVNTRYLKEIMLQCFGYTTQGLCEKVYCCFAFI